MHTIKDIIRCFLKGMIISIVVFHVIWGYSSYMEDSRNPLESKFYLVALDLYKHNIIENILWTAISGNLFAPDSISVHVIADFDKAITSNLHAPYERLYNSDSHYLLKFKDELYSIRFGKNVSIGRWYE